nr:MAG TPA: hypothetical protein [Caudoviricetes sp.]
MFILIPLAIIGIYGFRVIILITMNKFSFFHKLFCVHFNPLSHNSKILKI